VHSNEEQISRLRRLAWLLDSSIPIPGTRISIGLDALIGLVPFIGDLIGVAFSAVILLEAARLGVGKRILARMALNVALDGLVGLVPLAGDVFDAAWKANQRNVRLLNEWQARPLRTERASGWLVFGLLAVPLGLPLLLLALLLYGAGLAGRRSCCTSCATCRATRSTPRTAKWGRSTISTSMSRAGTCSSWSSMPAASCRGTNTWSRRFRSTASVP
jgi:hypothetical protein